MKSLAERVEDFKIMKKAVLLGENEHGYSINIKRVRINFLYSFADGKIVISGGTAADFQPRRVLDKTYSDPKKVCYDETIKYLMANTHVQFGMVIPKNATYHRTGDGEIFGVFSLTGLSQYLQRDLTRLDRLSDEEREKINWRRAKRGLEPVLSQNNSA